MASAGTKPSSASSFKERLVESLGKLVRFFRKHLFSYRTALLALFLLSIELILWGTARKHIFTFPNLNKDDTAKLVVAIGEAFLVALVLALVVDPYVKKRLMREGGYDLFWAAYSPDAPPELRQGLVALLKLRQYYRNVIITIEMEWKDASLRDALKLKICVVSCGVNLERRGFKPASKKWVLSSPHGGESSYDLWGLSVPSVGQHIVLTKDDFERAMDGGPIAERAEDGTLFICEERMQIEFSIPFEAEFVTERRATVFRAADDAFPIVHPGPALVGELRVVGSAEPDLNYDAFHAGLLPGTADWKALPNGGRVFPFGSMTFPGQVTMLSWRLKKPSVEVSPDQPPSGDEETP